jgi:uncharacterized protein (TIGR00730 family)
LSNPTSDPTPPAAGARAVAVFCGSRAGHDPAGHKAAADLGTGLAARGIRLIYGGGRTGLMGALADATLAAGGHVTGVIPDFLTRMEVAHTGVTALHVTESMHTRKRMMFDLADAFITLPGGLGTLDETVEMITWRQLGLHGKPVLLCNAGGWADTLLAALESTIAQGFAGVEARGLFDVLADVPAVLARLDTVRPAAAASGRT